LIPDYSLYPETLVSKPCQLTYRAGITLPDTIAAGRKSWDVSMMMEYVYSMSKYFLYLDEEVVATGDWKTEYMNIIDALKKEDEIWTIISTWENMNNKEISIEMVANTMKGVTSILMKSFYLPYLIAYTRKSYDDPNISNIFGKFFMFNNAIQVIPSAQLFKKQKITSSNSYENNFMLIKTWDECKNRGIEPVT